MGNCDRESAACCLTLAWRTTSVLKSNRENYHRASLLLASALFKIVPRELWSVGWVSRVPSRYRRRRFFDQTIAKHSSEVQQWSFTLDKPSCPDGYRSECFVTILLSPGNILRINRSMISGPRRTLCDRIFTMPSQNLTSKSPLPTKRRIVFITCLGFFIALLHFGGDWYLVLNDDCFLRKGLLTISSPAPVSRRDTKPSYSHIFRVDIIWWSWSQLDLVWTMVLQEEQPCQK